MPKIRVFVIDDSAVVRNILTQRFANHPQIEVVGSAIDPYVARDKLERLDVDVITLDIEMPRMDGLTFLKHLMRQRPLPVIVVSSLADASNQASLEALSLGAVDLVPKPGGPFSVEEVVDQLAAKIVAAHGVDRNKLAAQASVLPSPTRGPRSASIMSRITTTDQLLAVGASTGGTVAMEVLFKGFPAATPPTLAVIHMPARFTNSFARRLDDLCEVRVKEAEDQEPVSRGTVYIAPGDRHMTVRNVGSDRVIQIRSGPKVFNQRPAVDVLFDSVADEVGANAIAVLMTGMGRDGARGLLKLKERGARTICQDEASCIVFGMPKEAIALGAAEFIAPLDRIGSQIREIIRK